ncbi:T9SS type A sorting domain-containing protein [Hymenobacter cellulosivorans]|uniref:T9SS type A sorting domain-containing protein n=1 Tax=Hymenobacter cellulosivorans TaxID=2932249 RepID=A0ABY4FE90_9BACT|nr:T9SS type A sorting domain-containing protein [Hymenobacter cellulosivorans]UOQ54999.1 T9SS type A sorting domain-containing protein [Hymenobacter cellulosivorans]
MVVADFNADGKPDLAVANNSSATVSIRLGAANGTFTSAADVAVGTNPSSVTVGDFNADGRPDLAVANGGSNTVSIRLGAANGTFTSAADVAVGTNPSSVVVADFNADGKPDLAVANANGNSVSIRLGAGGGSFTGTTDVSVGLSPSSVAAADVDGDGDLDLAIVNSSGNSVSIRFNIDGGNNAGPLPVELTWFTAQRQDARQVQLRWATAQELHNAGFQVEKSRDGRRWQPLGFVSGQGSSTTAHQYSYQDAEAGAAYYRLVQQDQDGNETASPVRYVAGGKTPALQLFPNPATAAVQLLGSDATVEVQLLNLQGQVLRRLPAGTTQLELQGLPAGLYLVRCGQQVARLVVE